MGTTASADSQKIRELILRLKRRRKTFTLEEVQDCLETANTERVHAALAPLLSDGTIEPLKSAKGNGSVTAPVFEKYRIVSDPPPMHSLTELHPLLTSTSYLERHPAACHTWWNELTSLSAWLSQPTPEPDATLRERCWEVFGDEKASERRGFATCVYRASGRELRDILVVRADSPEDLPFTLSLGAYTPKIVLVSENRDPYLAIRSQLLLGKHSLFGKPLDAVVYGCGNVVRQSGGSSLEFALETMRAAQDATVYYWGDIDREGLSILATLHEAGLVKPFIPAYEAMLTSARNTPRESPDGRDLPMPCLDGLFPTEILKRIESIAQAQLLLPQEAVSFAALKEAMR